MNVTEETRSASVILLAETKKHMLLLEQLMQEILTAEQTDIPLLGHTSRSAVLLAGLMENYYTCAETVFVRISRFFENNLHPNRWHKDLLERMTLDLETIRPRVLSEETFRDLQELMRFRHFKRYYFGTDYDWERLNELLTRVKRVHGGLMTDLERFSWYIGEVFKESGNE